MPAAPVVSYPSWFSITNTILVALVLEFDSDPW